MVGEVNSGVDFGAFQLLHLFTGLSPAVCGGEFSLFGCHHSKNTFEKLLVLLEFTYFIKNQTDSNRFKNKQIINEFTVSVAVNIAGYNTLTHDRNRRFPVGPGNIDD